MAQAVEQSIELCSTDDMRWTGILFMGNTGKFWQIKCPCGVMVEFGVNKLPEVDTPHPCGNPNHWTVRYEA